MELFGFSALSHLLMLITLRLVAITCYFHEARSLPRHLNLRTFKGKPFPRHIRSYSLRFLNFAESALAYKKRFMRPHDIRKLGCSCAPLGCSVPRA
ncbi:hypothetical protein AOQ84DRAFT_44102 [Glonium stellatum]|uniref:Secreted protein n=1 Tax=Glonium stellatum TaxID=574774 RepID=A0A8E2F0L9_9PEZI|nr:hypothetical protein AOQ84DRAFT_44102 [Glonium stellatum]